ncbi:hypothetical protein [Rhodococcus sp. NPDC003348]
MSLRGSVDVELRYGINPQQRRADVVPIHAGQWPVRLLNGEPSYINLLDALNAWQLVSEASVALGKPAATSFKHVSPAGAAVSGPVDEVVRDLYARSVRRLPDPASAVSGLSLRCVATRRVPRRSVHRTARATPRRTRSQGDEA